MIVIDTSAAIAMLTNEQDGPAFMALAAADGSAVMSVVSLVEATAVAASKADDKTARIGLDKLFDIVGIRVEGVDRVQANIAREAYLKFGKGRGHPAQLNICDCFSYALAKSLDAPLLFKGQDFSHTDVKRVSP